MTNKERQVANVIAPWLRSLADLTNAEKGSLTQEKLSLYLGLLAQGTPVTAFTRDSLEAMARKFPLFPSYGPLKEALAEWLADQIVRAEQMTPISASLQDYLDTRGMNDAWQAKRERQMAEAKADWSDPVKVRATAAKIDPTHPMRLTVGRFFAALVRKHAPQNLGLLLPEWLDPNERG